MTNIVTITDADTDPVKLDVSPVAGGWGREAKANLGDNAAVESGVLLEGHDGLPNGEVPESDDDGWYTLLEAPLAAPVVEIADLPMFIRAGAALDGPIAIEGVQ